MDSNLAVGDYCTKKMERWQKEMKKAAKGEIEGGGRQSDSAHCMFREPEPPKAKAKREEKKTGPTKHQKTPAKAKWAGLNYGTQQCDKRHMSFFNIVQYTPTNPGMTPPTLDSY